MAEAMRAAALVAALAPREGERLSAEGKPIRSNVAWRELAESAIASAVAAEARAEDERRARDAAQARANNAEQEKARWLAAFDSQLAKFNALHGRYVELTGALAIVARHAKEAE